MGLVTGGEGMVGLSQAFILAGSRGVLASLWAVDDEATCALMQGFYRCLLKEKKSPRAALGEAQAEVQKKWPEPYYWGAWVYYGN